LSGAVEYFRIMEGEPLPDIDIYRPFRAIIVIDAPYSTLWQDQVSDWLAASGCLFMLAWGKDCTTWDDSVDYANLRQFSYGEIPEEHFIFTTWHANQALDEVFWEAENIGSHPVIALERTLILHIGARNRREEFLARRQIALNQSR